MILVLVDPGKSSKNVVRVWGLRPSFKPRLLIQQKHLWFKRLWGSALNFLPILHHHPPPQQRFLRRMKKIPKL